MKREAIITGIVSGLVVLAGLAIFFGGKSAIEASEETKNLRLEVDITLKRAATAQERYLVENGRYAEAEETLEQAIEPLYPGIVLLDVPIAMADRYCIQVGHERLDEDDPWRIGTYDSSEGVTSEDDTC